MKNLISIENDLFDISSRIKSLNRQYQIYFNRGTGRYEIHNCNFLPTLQVVLPYLSLDCRAIEYLGRTKIQNIDKIINEIEKNNKQLEDANHNQQKNNAYQKLDNCLSKLT